MYQIRIINRFANMDIYLYIHNRERDNSIIIYSYGTQIGFCSGFGDGYMVREFLSVTTRYHQGIASQILAYAKAGKWDYIYNSLKNSNSLRDLKGYFGYSYNKKYIEF